MTVKAQDLALDLHQALQVARQAAQAADAIAMGYFQGEFEVELKADQSPVTVADRACEQAIREVIAAHWPQHAILGEEFGGEPDAGPLWLIDPIDGTRSFIRGLPFWSVQIALMVEGELVLGVSSAPAFAETAWALRGHGAWVNGHRVAVRDPVSLSDADISFGNLRSLARSAEWPWVGSLVAQAARSRGYGDFYGYHRLIEGRQDAVIESDVNVLDIAALAVIVQEAGGQFTDLDGQPVGLETRSALAAGPSLHASLLSLKA